MTWAEAFSHLVDSAFTWPVWLLVFLTLLGRFVLTGIRISSTPKYLYEMMAGKRES